MRYKKAPILEAVLEFRWSESKSLDDLRKALTASVFEVFEEPKPRKLISASLDLANGDVSQQTREVGFDLARRDGTERIFLEEGKFVFIQSAPYDRWDYFSRRALDILEPTIHMLGVSEFTRVGVRFVNRIDAPLIGSGNFNTDDFITIKFDGPRPDVGVIDEFQMRVVKPTEKEGISYALIVATSPSPLPDFGGIVLDIDVFTRNPTPTSSRELIAILSTMRDEKNDIFEHCITDRSRELFGGLVE